MKKKLTQKKQGVIVITAWVMAVMLLNGSCNKNTNPDNTGKTNTPLSKVVYTDVKPDSVILKLREDSFYLDLNNDGINDFEFDRTYTLDRCSDNLLGTMAYDVDLSVKPANTDNAVMISGSILALALDSGTAITADSLWLPASPDLLHFETNASGHCVTSLPGLRGFWLHVSDKYLGLKFVKNKNTYYGWVRLSCTYDFKSQQRGTVLPKMEISIGQLVLKDYAYNSTPNLPIQTGQTK